MKKLLTVILALTLMLGTFCIGVGAEASVEDTFDAANFFLDDYMFFAEFCNGYFAEGEAPTAGTIYQYFLWYVPYMGEEEDEYLFEMDEYGFGTYHVPTEVYEENVLLVFGNEDATIEVLHASDYYKTDYYEIVVGGGFGGPLPAVVLQGYTEGEDGLITAYAYVADTLIYDEEWNEIPYVPAEDEVEGEDYIYICSNVYEYDEENDTYSEGVKYVPAKLSSGLKSVMRVDAEEWSATYYSYERIDLSDIPAAEDMTVLEKGKDIAYIGGAFMEIERADFDDGTSVFVKEYWDAEGADGEVIADTAELLGDYGELAGVYEFTALKDGATVQPNGKISVSFVLPNEFSPASGVYYIADDGSVTALETAIDPDSYDPTILYATAELEHFSRYAVAGYRYGDVDENGKVNVSDVSAMLKSVAKWNVEINDVTADANRDGKVNVADVSLVLKYIAKWEVWFGPAQ